LGDGIGDVVAAAGSASNEARLQAHAFYERAGFEEVGKRFVFIMPTLVIRLM
jgi:hypothetical protein